MILQSYAKLNLFLKVLNKRKDNYHNISTLFEKIDLCDTLSFKIRKDSRIKVTCNNPDVPLGSSNLCLRSAKLLQEKFRIKQGVEIKIRKRIPIGAGLGGGSSNAAYTLLALNKLWKLKLSRKKLAQLSANIGSDVAFFIYTSSFALGTGRGQIIRPQAQLDKVKLWHILVVPKIKVSTPLIYGKWDSFRRLTMPRYDVKILLSKLRKKDFSLGAELLFNGLEPVTAKLYPELERVKETLAESGLKLILMSGSGPAVFGIATSRKEAVFLSRKIRRQNRSRRVFVTRTL